MGLIKKIFTLFARNKKRSTDPQVQTVSNDQSHVMTEDEKVDEASAESMIASDPPGHISKSAEDKNLH